MLEILSDEFNKEQKIEFIRSVQSLYWTMTPAETLRQFNDEKINDLFEFQYKNFPSELLNRLVDRIRKEIK